MMGLFLGAMLATVTRCFTFPGECAECDIVTAPISGVSIHLPAARAATLPGVWPVTSKQKEERRNERADKVARESRERQKRRGLRNLIC